MATIRKTITLTDQQNTWIKLRIEDGYFTNESEYVRDLIRHDQERNIERDAICFELVKGEKSGISSRTANEIMQSVIERKQEDGKL